MVRNQVRLEIKMKFKSRLKSCNHREFWKQAVEGATWFAFLAIMAAMPLTVFLSLALGR